MLEQFLSVHGKELNVDELNMKNPQEQWRIIPDLY
jgi:hypothetical protein